MVDANSNEDSLIWLLPDVMLFYVVQFCEAPTMRARVILHQLAPTCSSFRRRVFHSQTLWENVLQQDYGVSMGNSRGSRSSKRLRKCPLDRVCDAHKLIQVHTEIAYYYASELAQNHDQKKLTKSKLVRILDEYGPRLRLNSVVSSGGTFLVEVSRARNVQESTILQCIQELVERRGALVDVTSSESNSSRLTALCVVAARGMPNVVRYLLDHGADPLLRMSGRFRLHTHPTRSIHCSHQTALGFAQKMEEMELSAGAGEADLTSLRKCIRLLSSTSSVLSTG